MVALPPLPILGIGALLILDIIQSALGVVGMLAFAALAGGNPEVSDGFGVGAWLFVVLMLAQIASVAGLFLARRWAVVLGAISFRLSLLYTIASVDGFWMVLPLVPTALFLICTLPYWERMTWRFL